MAAQVKDISDVKELEDSTSCCICTGIYKCPKLLPCGHTFCMNCIQETGLKISKGPGDGLPCPICRQKFKIPSVGFTGLQNNYYVEGLIRVSHMLDTSVGKLGACDACLEDNQEIGKVVKRAEMYCCDCKQKLCEECFRHHRKLKVTKNHRLILINEQRPADEDQIQGMVPVVCDLHIYEDLKIYCRTCKTCVCAVCFTENHEGHKGAHVNKAANEFRCEIANNIEKVKTCISEANMKKSEITKSRQDVVEKLESLESEIINRRDALKQAVDNQAKELLEELYSIRNSRMKEVLIETDNIDAQLTRFESYTTYCQKIMTKGSVCDICRSVGDLSARVNELQEENRPLIELKLKPINLCLVETEFEEESGGNLIGQLKERGHPKQMTKIKKRLVDEVKKENETPTHEVTAKKRENEDLKLANEKLKLQKHEQQGTRAGLVDMNRYPLKIERLRSYITAEDVRWFLDSPPVDVLESVEISNCPTSTAFVVLTRLGVAYKYLSLKEPEIDGNRVTLRPELFEEISMTINGSWLKEIEDEHSTIRVEIQKIADMFNLKLFPKKSVQGDKETISLAGVPWIIEQARTILNDKLQTIIMKRSANVLRK